MAQRYEIEAWLGGEWDAEQAAELVDRVMESGSDDEAVWVKIVTEYDGATDTSGVILESASRDYDRAGEVYGAARETFYEEVRGAVGGGMTMYAAAKHTGLSQTMIAKIVRGGTERAAGHP